MTSHPRRQKAAAVLAPAGVSVPTPAQRRAHPGLWMCVYKLPHYIIGADRQRTAESTPIVSCGHFVRGRFGIWFEGLDSRTFPIHPMKDSRQCPAGALFWPIDNDGNKLDPHLL